MKRQKIAKAGNFYSKLLTSLLLVLYSFCAYAQAADKTAAKSAAGEIIDLIVYIAVPLGIICFIVGGYRRYKGAEDGGFNEMIAGAIIAGAPLFTSILYNLFGKSGADVMSAVK